MTCSTRSSLPGRELGGLGRRGGASAIPGVLVRQRRGEAQASRKPASPASMRPERQIRSCIRVRRSWNRRASADHARGALAACARRLPGRRGLSGCRGRARRREARAGLDSGEGRDDQRGDDASCPRAACAGLISTRRAVAIATALLVDARRAAAADLAPFAGCGRPPGGLLAGRRRLVRRTLPRMNSSSVLGQFGDADGHSPPPVGRSPGRCPLDHCAGGNRISNDLQAFPPRRRVEVSDASQRDLNFGGRSILLA